MSDNTMTPRECPLCGSHSVYRRLWDAITVCRDCGCRGYTVKWENRAPSPVEAELREALRPIRQHAQTMGFYEIVNMIDAALQKVGGV